METEAIASQGNTKHNMKLGTMATVHARIDLSKTKTAMFQ